jgi:hypothetical protein
MIPKLYKLITTFTVKKTIPPHVSIFIEIESNRLSVSQNIPVEMSDAEEKQMMILLS